MQHEDRVFCCEENPKYAVGVSETRNSLLFVSRWSHYDSGEWAENMMLFLIGVIHPEVLEGKWFC